MNSLVCEHIARRRERKMSPIKCFRLWFTCNWQIKGQSDCTRWTFQSKWYICFWEYQFEKLIGVLIKIEENNWFHDGIMDKKPNSMHPLVVKMLYRAQFFLNTHELHTWVICKPIPLRVNAKLIQFCEREKQRYAGFVRKKIYECEPSAVCSYAVIITFDMCVKLYFNA